MMVFQCVNDECSEYEVDKTSLVPVDPPVYCGVCGTETEEVPAPDQDESQ
jgi:hypothetical protein